MPSSGEALPRQALQALPVEEVLSSCDHNGCSCFHWAAGCADAVCAACAACPGPEPFEDPDDHFENLILRDPLCLVFHFNVDHRFGDLGFSGIVET